MVDLVRKAYGGQLAFEAQDSIPKKVFVTVYRQQIDSKDQVMINLLNATGSNLKRGDVVPETNPQPHWPALEKDIEFEIDLPKSIKEAYIVSPDFEGRRPVKVTNISNRYKVTVDSKDLTWYSIVYFDLQ